MVRTSMSWLATAACLIALSSASGAQGKKEASSPKFLVKAQGHPMLHGFEVMSNKRADLRLARVTKPLDVAFTDWLRAERPHVYRQHEIEFIARNGGNPTGKQATQPPPKPQKRTKIAQK